MSKESNIKKRLERLEKENKNKVQAPQEEKKTAPAYVPVYRRRRRKLNKKFIVTFAIWLAALIAALFFLNKGI